jgi:hypothetical protein
VTVDLRSIICPYLLGILERAKMSILRVSYYKKQAALTFKILDEKLAGVKRDRAGENAKK